MERALPIHTIIAALSLDPDSNPVAERAFQLAAQHNARLILVHVIETAPHTASMTTSDSPSPLLTLRQEAQHHIQQKIDEKLRQNAVDIVIREGAPYAIIRELQDREQADLLIIGPGKAQTVREHLFGSTADRLVRLSSCPVLIVRNEKSRPYERISVAIDFSTLSAAAFHAAAEVGEGAAIDVVHIVDIPLSFEQAALKAGTPHSEIASYRQAKAGSARKQVEDFLVDKQPNAPSIQVRIFHGSPANSLVTLSAKPNTDLLALGLQGQNIITRALIGSVAQRVLRAAACDILTVGAEALN